MIVKLIQPSMQMRPMDTRLKTQMAPSLALWTLAALTPPEHTVVMENENTAPLRFDEAVDLVGITVTVDVLPRACEIAARYRAMGVPVVAGGIHVTCDPVGCAPFFDALCVGMAEPVWARILADAQRGTLAPVYEGMDTMRGEQIASPAYRRMAEGPYLYTNIVTTSRGCPFQCDFCYNSSNKACLPYLERPIEDVLRDIQAIGGRHILFVDDNFIGNPARTRELLLRLKPLRLRWNAAVTANLLQHLDLLDLMRESGCQSLFIGLESLHPGSLRDVHKGQNHVERYDALIAEIHKRGIMVNASLVFGLDHDTPQCFEETYNYLVSRKVETVTAHILTPYPGTALYRRMLAQGRIVDRDLSHYNTAHVVFTPRSMTAAQLQAGYLRFYKRFYSWRSILRRMPDARTQRVPYLLFNLLYRKFGRFTAALARLVPMRALGRLSSRWAYCGADRARNARGGQSAAPARQSELSAPGRLPTAR